MSISPFSVGPSTRQAQSELSGAREDLRKLKRIAGEPGDSFEFSDGESQRKVRAGALLASVFDAVRRAYHSISDSEKALGGLQGSATSASLFGLVHLGFRDAYLGQAYHQAQTMAQLTSESDTKKRVRPSKEEVIELDTLLKKTIARLDRLDRKPY